MAISYTMIDPKGVKSDRPNAACYYEHYGKLNQYATVLVYSPKSFMAKRTAPTSGYGAKMYAWDAFTTEEYKEYVRLLNGMGFKFTMAEEKERFVFTVQIKDNSIVANKIILNAIRYLCENPYPSIVKEFLLLAKQKMVGVNNYTKFILAHNAWAMGHGGHSFIPGHVLTLPLSNKDFKEKVLSSNSDNRICVMIPQCTKPFQTRSTTEKDRYGGWAYIDMRTNLFKMFEARAPLKDLIKEYKAICAKSM